MGYIGSSPMFPGTAFSIRLLQFYHVLWKYSAVRLQPFTLAIDELLDANNPLLFAPGTNQVSGS